VTAFILVHGGCHGPECWAPLVERLKARGHQADAVALPGHGWAAYFQRHHAGLTDGIDAVAAAIRAAAGPVVLVGHSLGGLSISGAAELYPERVRTLVYVTALLPRDGECAGDFARFPDFNGSEGSEILDEDWVTVRADRARALFYADCDPADADAAIAALCPTDIDYLTQPLHLTAARFGSVAKLYIACTEDAAIGIGAQRAMIALHPGISVRELPSSHSPFMSMPDRLVELLETA
jgi:pimeloyl-ACP methyl ester carboxylesterase